MMDAQGDAVVGVQATLGKEDYGQDVVGLQMIPPAAAPAATVPRSHAFGPFFARPALSERLLDAAVHVVGVVLPDVQFREQAGPRFVPFAHLRTVGTVAASVLAGFVGGPTHFARQTVDSWVGQRLVDRVQKVFILAYGSHIPAEVFACLEVGTEGVTRFRHHPSEGRLARLAAELASGSVPAAPGAISSDHMSWYRHNGGLPL